MMMIAVVFQVTLGTLASQYLSPGDKILEIDDLKSDSLLQSEINRLIFNEKPSLHLLVEKRANDGKVTREIFLNGNVRNLSSPPPATTAPPSSSSYDKSKEREYVKENENGRQSTKIWMREKNRNSSLGEYDLEVNFQRTKYKQQEDDDVDTSSAKGWKKVENNRKSQERMKILSDNFDTIFRQKIGEWLEENMLGSSRNDFPG